MSTATMLIRSIRMITFLTFTLLVPSCSCMNCTCKCLYHTENKYGSVCDMINKLQTDDDLNGAEIKKLRKKTTDLTDRFDVSSEESPMGKFARKIAELESTTESLKSDSRQVRDQVLNFKELTLREIRAESDARSRLRDEMRSLEHAMRESDRQRVTLAERLINLENLSLESQESLTSKFHGMENKIRKLELEIAAKSKEDLSRTSEVRKELLERVEEVEKQTLKTKTEVLDRLGETENRLGETDRLIQQMQKAIDAMADWSRIMEIKSVNLKAKMKKMKKVVSKLKSDVLTNFSLSVEHLKAYTDDHFTQLKQIGENLKLNVSQMEDSLVRLDHELSNCATIGNLSDLDRAVREEAIASRIEHQSLRIELSNGDEEVRKHCADRDDVTEMNRTLASLSTDLKTIQEHSKKKEVKVKTKCEDSLPLATCTKLVKEHMCKFEYTATKCCDSCAKSVGFVPRRTSEPK